MQILARVAFVELGMAPPSTKPELETAPPSTKTIPETRDGTAKYKADPENSRRCYQIQSPPRELGTTSEGTKPPRIDCTEGTS